MELWNTSLKKIGGNFGMGIVAYFLFIKWILFLNLILFTIIALILVLPTLLLGTPRDDTCASINDTDTICCPELYWNKSLESYTFLNFFEGGNLFEYSLLFYGAYSSSTYFNENGDYYYNFPLTYIVVMITIFIVSLIAVLRSSVKGFKERVVEGEGQFYQYCNLIFGGWDYCINNEKASEIKHKALHNEIKILIESERYEDERTNRTREEKFKLCLVRIFVNAIVLLILCSCGVFIFYVIRFSFEQIYSEENMTQRKSLLLEANVEAVYQLFFEFLPYTCIFFLNIGIPVLFRHLITLENYSPTSVVRITLFRTIFLRLASLAVLLSSFYVKIIDNVNEDDDDDSCTNSSRPLCWETFVGQQFLKLYVTDVVGQFFMTFFINFPRSFIGKNSDNKILKFIGQQQFDLSKHVLDIVYLQTVCWLGVFFTPFLPLFGILGSFLLFYIKKFACLVNSRPTNQIYRASKSKSLFMFVLLVCYVLVIVPIGFCFIKIVPSKACGPFKGLDSPWSLVIATFFQLPIWLRSAITFFGTAGFGVPAFLLLTLLLYYYYAVSMANKNMVTVLRNQLVLEGHDKQFLLNRLSAFIKQQQEQTKYHQDMNEYAN